MIKRVTIWLGLSMALMSGRADASYVTINFDELANNTVVTTQYASVVTFGAGAGDRVEVANYAASYGTSGPNFIGTASATTGVFDYSHDVSLNFTNPVSGLKFNAAGVDSVGQAAIVEVFQSGGQETNVSIIGTGDSLTPVLVDLSSFSNVTAIAITDVTDMSGIAYDDFSFNTPSVPEPPSAILTGTGLVAGLATCWRRKSRGAPGGSR